MTNTVYVLATNKLIGSIVEEVYRDKLSSSLWSIQVVLSDALTQFRPNDHSLVVVDRRLTDYVVHQLGEWSDREVFYIPFDETDFDGIHESFLAFNRPKFDSATTLVQ